MCWPVKGLRTSREGGVRYIYIYRIELVFDCYSKGRIRYSCTDPDPDRFVAGCQEGHRFVMTSDAYKRIRSDVMFSYGSNRVIIEHLSLYLVCLPSVLIIIILRVLI